ncbi:MAG: branched-chain amino acid ABC transporter ATP-binding protein [Acidobacteria bacterium]|nr:MAG: branched-chain amino acid ABC transporter ATP-binding protein [Acidobacteriota bacterium]
MAEALLRVEALDAAYDAVQVVWGLDLQVQAGTVTSLIGSNGAGKTTTMNVIAGTLPARRGEIIFRGEDITTKPPHLRVGMRLSLIPEQRQLWPRMTVEENLLLGAFPRRLRGKAKENLKNIYEMFPRLGERRKQHAGTLSGGEQQMCAIGRGLMAEPLLLMLDEPSLGLAPMLVDEIFHYVRVIAARGVTILLAAQNANYALQFSDYSYVMESGRIALEGRSEKLRCDDHVRRAYMGAAS